MENKPNQHYVWQKYLAPWVKDGKIVCLRNKKDIIQSNPRNIASGRYFYNINSMTQDDCKLIRKIFINNQPEPMKILLEGWIKPIEEFLQLYNSLAKCGEVKESAEASLELGLKNLLEELHMEIENAGMSGLSKLQLGDISFLSECKDGCVEDVEFIIYLCFQYFRTKNIKQNVKESLGEHASLFTNYENAFNLVVPIVSTLLGNSLLNRIKSKELYCYLLKNDTEISFITGDQPVINIHANLNKNVGTTDLELYYPLSPTLSLLITKEQICNIECSVEKVKYYNNMIERQSLELIFANDENAVYPYILNL